MLDPMKLIGRCIVEKTAEDLSRFSKAAERRLKLDYVTGSKPVLFQWGCWGVQIETWTQLLYRFSCCCYCSSAELLGAHTSTILPVLVFSHVITLGIGWVQATLIHAVTWYYHYGVTLRLGCYPGGITAIWYIMRVPQPFNRPLISDSTWQRWTLFSLTFMKVNDPFHW